MTAIDAIISVLLLAAIGVILYSVYLEGKEEREDDRS